MKISQMPLSTTPSSDDVLAMLEGGTQNKKITFGAVAEWIANEEEIDNLNTDNKTIVGAVNELEELIGDATADTHAKIENLQDTAYVTNTASGDIAAFSDGAAVDAKSVVIHVEPVQAGSGDPSPDNVRPISGRTGATVWRTGENLLPMPLQSGAYQFNATITVNDDKSFYFSKPSVAGWTTIELGGFSLPAGTYTLIEKEDTPVGSNQNSSLSIRYADTDEQIVQTRYSKRTVFTLNKTSDVLFRFARADASDNVLIKLMLFVGNTATDDDYVPYTGTTIPVSWETEAGTVYGGTVDAVSGVLTVDRVGVAINDLTWTYDSTNTRFATWSISNVIHKPSANNVLLAGLMSSAYVARAETQIAANDGSIGVLATGQLIIKDTNYTMASDFVSAMGAQNIVYPLDTPQTYQLTPQQIQTLLGENKIWSDAGSVDVDYRADVKTYINSLFDNIQKNMAYIETGTTASRAYTAGQYVIVGGTMYKVSAEIASGATFTPGTNIVATTVGTELTALNA